MKLNNVKQKVINFPTKLDNIVYKLSLDPAIPIFISFLIGFLLIIWSIVIGNFSVDFNGVINQIEIINIDGKEVEKIEIKEIKENNKTKEVGYILAFNWGFTGAILIPLMILFFLNVRGNIEKTLSQLSSRKMLKKEDGKVVSIEEICELWKNRSRIWITLSFFVFLIVVLFSMWDFIKVVHTPFYNIENVIKHIPPNEYTIQNNVLSIKIDHKINEFDWSVGALFENTTLSIASNYWFSMCAYIWIAAIGGGIGFGAITYLIGFGTFIRAKNLANINIYLVLDKNSKDKHKRGGFEVFEDYFTNLIALCTIILMILYLMNIQNIYLRDFNSGNIFQFIFSDIHDYIKIFNFDFNKMDEKVDSLLTQILSGLGKILDNVQSSIAFIIASFIITFIYTFQFYTFHSSSQDAKQNTLKSLNNDTEIEKANNVTHWPLSWLSLRKLFFISIIMLASFIFFKLLVIMLIYLVFKAKNEIFPKRSK